MRNLSKKIANSHYKTLQPIALVSFVSSYTDYMA